MLPSFPSCALFLLRYKKASDNELSVTGDLTIRDVTRPITLQAEIGGSMVDFYGQTKVGFDATGTIQRKDFGLSWDAVTEAGGVVVSNDVKLQLAVQFTKQ